MKEREERGIGFLAVIFVRFGVGVEEAVCLSERARELCAPQIFLLRFCAPLSLSLSASLGRRPSFLSPSSRSSFHKRWVVHFLAVARSLDGVGNFVAGISARKTSSVSLRDNEAYASR